MIVGKKIGSINCTESNLMITNKLSRSGYQSLRNVSLDFGSVYCYKVFSQVSYTCSDGHLSAFKVTQDVYKIKISIAFLGSGIEVNIQSTL